MGDTHVKKGGTWVLKDEILHCVQNDKVRAWVPKNVRLVFHPSKVLSTVY
jgi:hypothetical protein